MIVITNRIKVKKGMGEVMAPSFTAPGPLDTFDGFVKCTNTVASVKNR